MAGSRPPFRVALWSLATGGLYVAVWWYRVTRDVGAQSDSSRFLRPFLSALSVALSVVGLWSFLWVSALLWPRALGTLAILCVFVGSIGTVASVGHTAASIRSLEQTIIGRPELSRRRLKILAVALLLFVLTWPIVVVNFVYTIEQHLDRLLRSRRDTRRGMARGDGRYAWAGWTRWRGYRGLLARIARACLSVAGELAGRGNSVIEVRALGDRERFKTPEEFKEDATPEALRNFQTIRINTTGERLRVRVRLARGCRHGALPFGTGVVLAVHGSRWTSPEEVLYARRVIAAAIQRGSKRRWMVIDGQADEGPRMRALRSASWEAERFIRTVVVAVFAVSYHVGFYLVAPSIENLWIRLAAFQAGAAIGSATSFAFATLLLPNVSVAETAARERIRRLAGQVAVAAVSALFGAAVKRLLGG
jgi:hypothetical protein